MSSRRRALRLYLDARFGSTVIESYPPGSEPYNNRCVAHLELTGQGNLRVQRFDASMTCVYHRLFSKRDSIRHWQEKARAAFEDAKREVARELATIALRVPD